MNTLTKNFDTLSSHGVLAMIYYQIKCPPSVTEQYCNVFEQAYPFHHISFPHLYLWGVN